MGKQKLTYEKVELIKYLLKSTSYTQETIGAFLETSRENVTNIKHNRRWSEVITPDDVRGKLLYYKLLNNELK